MKLLQNKTRFLSFIILFCLVINCFSQVTSDSLNFSNIVVTVVKSNPLVKQAEEKANSALFKEDLVKTAYLPIVSAGASVNRIEPIPAFEFGGNKIQMVPDFGMDFGIKLNQLIYDFGKTKDNLGLQQTSTEINNIAIEQIKQRLALSTAVYFYTLVYVQSAINIKADEVNTLKQHLSFVENKQKTGSATEYELLSTKVRISLTETQLTELMTSREVQISHLNNLMDTILPNIQVKADMSSVETLLSTDSSYSYALNHREDALIAEKKINIAEWNYKVTGSQNRPYLMFVGNTGMKNGYLPDVNSLELNYMVGLSLNVPIFDGNRTRVSRKIASSGIAESKYEQDNVKNIINDEVRENYVSLQLADQKIRQYKTQLEQATEAYNHAQTNYKTGAITNLDLLDASNALAESKLQLLKSQIDYKMYIIKYKNAIGERLY